MDTPDDSAADKNSVEKTEGEANTRGADAAANELPNVDSPRLAGADADDEDAAQGAGNRPQVRSALPALFRAPFGDDEAAEESASAPAQPRSFRFALLAASIATAAGVGALFGAFAAAEFGHQQHAAIAAIPRTNEARDVVAALKVQVAEISALKASLDAAKSNTGAQFAKIGERLDNLERAQTEPAAKLARLAEEIDRLEKRTVAAPETTGSIAASPAATATVPSASPSAPILHDWAVQEVHNGRAMIESRYGGFFLVGSGSILPGLGHVQDVKRQKGEWIVVTDKGLITQHP